MQEKLQTSALTMQDMQLHGSALSFITVRCDWIQPALSHELVCWNPKRPENQSHIEMQRYIHGHFAHLSVLEDPSEHACVHHIDWYFWIFCAVIQHVKRCSDVGLVLLLRQKQKHYSSDLRHLILQDRSKASVFCRRTNEEDGCCLQEFNPPDMQIWTEMETYFLLKVHSIIWSPGFGVQIRVERLCVYSRRLRCVFVWALQLFYMCVH